MNSFVWISYARLIRKKITGKKERETGEKTPEWLSCPEWYIIMFPIHFSGRIFRFSRSLYCPLSCGKRLEKQWWKISSCRYSVIRLEKFHSGKHSRRISVKIYGNFEKLIKKYPAAGKVICHLTQLVLSYMRVLFQFFILYTGNAEKT